MVRYCFTHGFGPYAPEDLAGPLACKQRCVSSLSHHNVPKEKRSTLPIPLIQSLVNRRRTPGAPEFSQQEKEDATACKIAISRGESPETLLRSRLESGTSSRPAAAVCLLEADEKSHIDANLGQITLNWLWDQRSDLLYPDDNDLVYAMVRLVVREGEEEQILRWIRAETLRPSDLPPYIRYEWRSTALKALVVYKAQIAKNGCLDEALDTFFQTKPLYVSYGGPATWLHSQLWQVVGIPKGQETPTINGGRSWKLAWPNTSAHIYDAMSQENRLNTSSPVNDARTALYHPRGPDPDPVLAMFLAAAADSDREHPLWTMRKHETRHVFRMSATHGSEELRRQGRMEEAKSLEKARDVVLPVDHTCGDRQDREGISTQAKQKRPLPPPKFKPW